MTDNEPRRKPAKLMVNRLKVIRCLGKRIKMVEDHHSRPLAIKLPRDIIKDSMANLKVPWSILRAMDRWATTPTIPTHHMDNQAKFTSSASTRTESSRKGMSSPSVRFPRNRASTWGDGSPT